MRRIAIALAVWGLICGPVAAQTLNVSPNPAQGLVNEIQASTGSGQNKDSGVGLVADANHNIFQGVSSGNLTTTSTYNFAYGNGALAVLTGMTGSYGGNVGIGYNAGHSITTALGTVAIGYEAGEADTCSLGSVYIGNLAGMADTGTSGSSCAAYPELSLTVAIGQSALAVATSPYHCVALGQGADADGTVCNEDTYVGSHAGGNGSGAGSNTAIGASAMDTSNTTGGSNVAVGFQALDYLGGSASHATCVGTAACAGVSTATNTNGENTAVGYNALLNLAGAGGVTAIGNQAAETLTNQFSDTFVGYQSGQNSTAFRSTYLGTQTGQFDGGNADIYIGAGAGSLCRNCGHFLIAGDEGSAAYITDAYIGNGNAAGTPQAVVLHGTGNKTANGNGASFTLAGGKGMGTGTGGPVILATSPGGTANYATTAASGTGTTATVTAGGGFGFTPQVGDEVVVAGVTPTGFNGTFSITAASGTTVSYLSSATGPQTVAGTVALENPLVVAATVDSNQGLILTRAIVAAGTKPTLTGTCSTASQVGGMRAGSFTATCTAQTVIMSFAYAAPNGWTCVANDLTTPADTLKQTGSGTGSCTFTGTTVSTDTINFLAEAF